MQHRDKQNLFSLQNSIFHSWWYHILFCSLEYYVRVKVRVKTGILVNARFSFVSSYEIIYVILWITELRFTNTTLNNMLCKIERSKQLAHCKVLYFA